MWYCKKIVPGEIKMFEYNFKQYLFSYLYHSSHKISLLVHYIIQDVANI